MAEQYTNIRLILDKLLRNPMFQDLNIEAAVDYTVDFMRLVGVPDMFEEKVTTIEVEKYRAALPCDYYQMIQVKLHGGDEDKVFKYSSDSFHMENDSKRNCDLTYKVQGGIIYTSIENGCLDVAYEAIPVDESGYPMIPDNSSFTRALKAYIKKEHYTILFDLGKISPAVLQQAQQDYAWAVGDCQTEFNRLSLDKAESFYNSWKELIVHDHHKEGFKNLGSERILK